MKEYAVGNEKKPLNKIWVFIFWIIVWQLAYYIIQRDIYVPSPISVFFRLKELVLLSEFWKSVASSIYRVITGLFLSIVMGIIIGTISSMNDYVYQLMQPLVTIVKSTPVLSFIIIALIWFS